MTKNNFSEKLKELRLKNKYTQKFVADFLGLTQRQYQYCEQGHIPSQFDVVIKMCRLYDIDANELFGIGKMNKYDENLTALLGLIIEDLGNMKKDYNAEDLIRFQKLEECFADFKNLCDEQGTVDDTTPIANLDLSVRTTNLLVRGRIKTISDLENSSFEQICGLRNMGWKCAKEIYDKLIDLKFKRYKK